MFFIDGEADEIIEELETIPSDNQVKKVTSSVIDMKFPHDGIDMLKYFTSDEPTFMGTDREDMDDMYGEDDKGSRSGCVTSNYGRP